MKINNNSNVLSKTVRSTSGSEDKPSQFQYIFMYWYTIIYENVCTGRNDRWLWLDNKAQENNRRLDIVKADGKTKEKVSGSQIR